MTRERGAGSNSVVVGLGIGFNGFGTLAMLGLASRGLEDTAFAAFGTWWISANLLILPFGVFEALIARQVVSHRAACTAPNTTVGMLAGRSWLLWLVMVAALFTFADHLDERLFGGHNGAAAGLALFVGIGAAQAQMRGFAAGSNRFSAVGTQLAADGLLRAALVGCAVATSNSMLVVTGATTAGAGISLVLGTLILPRWLVRPRWTGADVTVNALPLLLVGAFGPMVINNASVPWLSSNGANAAIVAAFTGALTLSRVPVQLSGAVFGPLLQAMAHAVETGDRTKHRALLRRSLTLSASTAVAFSVTYTFVGAPLVRLLLGGDYQLPRFVYGLLALSAGLMLVATVVQASPAALNQWADLAVAWVTGGAVFGAVLTMPVGAVARASIAPAAAASVALCILLLSSARSQRSPAPGRT